MSGHSVETDEALIDEARAFIRWAGEGSWGGQVVADLLNRVTPPIECDNYVPPLTCLNAPSTETGRCDKCRVATAEVDAP